LVSDSPEKLHNRVRVGALTSAPDARPDDAHRGAAAGSRGPGGARRRPAADADLLALRPRHAPGRRPLRLLASGFTVAFGYRPDPGYRGPDAFTWHGAFAGATTAPITTDVSVDRVVQCTENAFPRNGLPLRNDRVFQGGLVGDQEAGDDLMLAIRTPPGHGRLTELSDEVDTNIRVSYTPDPGSSARTSSRSGSSRAGAAGRSRSSTRSR
jgi:hypothetical protein